MKYNHFCYYPYQTNNTRNGFLLPFVGGLLIGGLATPLLTKNNNYYPYPNYQYQPYYQYGHPVYSNYSYPYQNVYYKY